MSGTTTVFVRDCLDRMRAGDEHARDELISAVCRRMQHLARRMLDDYAKLRRWEQTDDVFSGAAMRLTKALRAVTPESPKHFYRLAALQIRRELKELARQHGRKQVVDLSPASPDESVDLDPADATNQPGRLARWAELHERVETLPEDHREVFEAIWYHQISQTEAAEILGISRRTVIRRWQAACLELHDCLQELVP